MPLESYDVFNLTHTYSVAGLPVAVVPIGTEGGLPIGIQVVANPFHDRVALAVAAILEAARRTVVTTRRSCLEAPPICSPRACTSDTAACTRCAAPRCASTRQRCTR